MSVSRRSFLSTVGATAAGATTIPWISARGQEALVAARPGALPSPRLTSRGAAPELIRLDSNENAHGPAPEAVQAITRTFAEIPRYPDLAEERLRAAIAAQHQVSVESVILGCGSTEILRFATEACTSPSRHLVTVAPTFETPTRVAERLGVPVRAVRVDSALRLDLDAMYDASAGAGLVFICNPNNPTGTAHSASAIRDFVARVAERSPETFVLIDEAYFEFADDPAYGTALPLTRGNPRVIVSRTFSKVFGLAGLRVGYAIAQPATVTRLDPFRLVNGINLFAAEAAKASLELGAHVRRQQALNRDAKAYTVAAIAALGCEVVPSQTNFVMADIGRDPGKFQEECRARGVAVGRPFPPLTSHARISIGTMDEMKRALPVIAQVLKRA
jgi:histidinol-phosphate aminotransferase